MWNQRNKDVEFNCGENDSGERSRAIMALLSYNVFHSYVSLERQNVALYGNGLNYCQTVLYFRP